MFERWGHRLYRRRWIVLAGSVLTLVVAAVWGVGLFGVLAGGGFEDPGSESTQAAEAAQGFDRPSTDVLALYRSERLRADDPAFRTAVLSTLQDLPPSAVAEVRDWYHTRAPQLLSRDRHATVVAITLAGDVEESFESVRGRLAAPGLTTSVGGPAAVEADINSQVEHDITRAEALSMPVLFVLSLFVFGSVVSALLPIGIGVLAIFGGFALLRLMTLVTDVSIFAINIITLIGLGLAIDYALFIVSRFREELSGVADVETAIARTLATAGRTVAFSGITIAAALASLLLFPQLFLQSMGFGGMAAVLVAMLAALTTLPALLALLGRKVESLRVPGLRWRRDDSDGGGWARLAHAVMRRPLAVIAVVGAVVLLLGWPFLRVEFGGVDERVLPEGTPSRTVAEQLASDFPGGSTSSATVVLQGVDSPAVASYAERLDALPDVTGVEVAARDGSAALLEVGYRLDPQSGDARQLVEQLRDVPVPAGARALVGGETAELVDLLDSLSTTLPWMALVVVAVMMVLLFLAFGSVVLPVKAVLMNAVSIVASFGVVVLIFQDGHLADLLGFTPTGTIEATQPILMLAILFGLSMDYEVFLLSRIREAWDRTHDNAESVALGLQRTGRIITSAAVLLAVVIGAFATSGITFIKMIGVGMLIAILMDATIVRALLVPATMRLLGSANWWAPAGLRRWWERHGLQH